MYATAFTDPVNQWTDNNAIHDLNPGHDLYSVGLLVVIHAIWIFWNPVGVVHSVRSLLQNKPLLIREQNFLKLVWSELQSEVAGGQTWPHVGWTENLGEVWPVGSEFEVLPQKCPDLFVAHVQFSDSTFDVSFGLVFEELFDPLDVIFLWEGRRLASRGWGLAGSGLDESVLHPLELSEQMNLPRVFEVEFFAESPPDQNRVLLSSQTRVWSRWLPQLRRENHYGSWSSAAGRLFWAATPWSEYLTLFTANKY